MCLGLMTLSDLPHDRCWQFSVAIFRGAGGTFCAGADLTAAFENLSKIRSRSGSESQTSSRANYLDPDMDMPGPMG